MEYFQYESVVWDHGTHSANKRLSRSTFTHLTGYCGGFNVELSLHTFKAANHSLLTLTGPCRGCSNTWKQYCTYRFHLFCRIKTCNMFEKSQFGNWTVSLLYACVYVRGRNVGIRNRLRGKWRVRLGRTEGWGVGGMKRRPVGGGGSSSVLQHD